MEYITTNPKETEKLAGFLFEKFTKTDRKKAMVIALEGELGAGKTTFTRGLARKLKIKNKIKSPTFNLIKNYPITDYGLRIKKSVKADNSQFAIRNFNYLYHLDCYRLRDHKDLKTIGIKEILNDSANIVLIEWSDRVQKILPKNHIRIHIDHLDRNTRKLVVRY